MRILGLVAKRPTAPLFAHMRKAPIALLASALLLSACVSPNDTTSGDAAPALVDQPAIVTDPTIYAARSDGKFSVPGLPVEQIPESHRRQVVAYETEQPPGTIIIDPRTKLLYYVLGGGEAIRYGISVGAEGFQWSGEAIVSNKRQWPTWTPPAEMIDRKPSLEKWRNGQPGGPTNPLGSRAIYLTSNGRDYGYRIHGTPEWQTIGRNASSGCFRMINQDVMDLFERVKGGEKVIVLTSKGEMPNSLSIPKPPAPKKAVVKPAAPALPPMIGPALPVPAAAAADTPPSVADQTGAQTGALAAAPATTATAPELSTPAVSTGVATPTADNGTAAGATSTPAATPDQTATPAPMLPTAPAASPEPVCTGAACPQD